MCELRAKVAAVCALQRAASNTHRISSRGSPAGCEANSAASSRVEAKQNIFIKCNQEMHVIRIPSHIQTHTHTHTASELPSEQAARTGIALACLCLESAGVCVRVCVWVYGCAPL